MSQNRQAHKDRRHAQQDYEVNLMAEIEIRDLHDKLDSLRFKQMARAVAHSEASDRVTGTSLRAAREPRRESGLRAYPLRPPDF